ncbi:guanine deaminase [Nocardiopsis sediminis]|uniref:Guanine deaminase n=1 Tax=Nocardiopsis sediminis TaxID=1778267 RepID=A0ABV8FS60_9ACTN
MEGFDDEPEVPDARYADDRPADRGPTPAEEGSLVPGSLTAVRGRLLWFGDDPFLTCPSKAVHYYEDGLLVCEDGKITYAGPYESARNAVPPRATFVHYPNHIIMPGFVDTHTHYTQTGMIASYGEELIEWLEKYAYPEEMKFRKKEYADKVANLFCDELLRNGTTSALVMCATYPQSVDALFEASNRRGMRLAAGKVLMDRNAPKELLDESVEEAKRQTEKLIDKWHGNGRSVYAVIPRFAISCTSEMLYAASELWKSRRGLLMHTHVSENPDEIAKVRCLFPDADGYLDVYKRHGLLGKGAIFAHGVHLTLKELATCHKKQSALAHCPTANLFLGSGLFSLRDAKRRARPVEVGLGTDVGAGTSFSVLALMNEAYKIAALKDYPVDAVRLFYLATLGGARTLRMHKKIGKLEPGYEADFIVLDPEATPVLANRTRKSEGRIEELLFALATLGDDRAVEATYVAGRLVHNRDKKKSGPRQNNMVFSHYDWPTQSWTPGQELGFTGKRAPSIEAFAGGLHCVYNDASDRLNWTVYTRQGGGQGTWSPAVNLGAMGTGTIAPYHDYLHLCYTDIDKKVQWRFRGADPQSSWGPERQLVGISSDRPPSITAYNDFLHIMVPDRGGRLQWNMYCSKTNEWSGWKPLWDVSSQQYPVSIAAYAGRLYVMYCGGGNARWTSYDSKTDAWRPHEEIKGTHHSYRTRISHYNGLIYAIGYREAGGFVENWWAKMGADPDMQEWTEPEPVPDIGFIGSYGTGLTPYHGLLYCAHF